MQKSNMKLATIVSYISLLAGTFLSLIYTPFMLSTLGSAEYGLFSLVNTIIAYIYLLDMGLGNAVIRYNSKYIAQNKQSKLAGLNGMFLSLYTVITVIAIGIGIIILGNMDVIFGKGLTGSEIQQLQLMFFIALINFAFALPLSIFNGIIMANEKYVFTKVFALVRTILNPLVMVAVLLYGYGAVGMLVASSVFNITLGFINVWYCFTKLDAKFNFRYFDKSLLKEIFKYSFFVFLGSIAYRIYWSTDQFLLGMFVGAAPIAIYAVGSQFNSYFTSFSNVISGLFLPKMTKMIHSGESQEQIMKLLVRVSRIQYFIAFLVLSGFILVGDSFVEIWAGTEYESAYWIAILIMVPQVFSIIQSLFATLLEAMNKHRVKSLIYLVVSIINIIITLILIPTLGIFGCALGTAIGMMINAVTNNFYYAKVLKLDMRYYWKEIGKLLFPSTIVVFLGYVLKIMIAPQSYIDIFIYVGLFGVMYLIVLWLLSFNKTEKALFLATAKKIKRRG